VVQINGSIDIGTVSNEIVLIDNTILHITDYTSISIFEFSTLKNLYYLSNLLDTSTIGSSESCSVPFLFDKKTYYFCQPDQQDQFICNTTNDGIRQCKRGRNLNYLN
jgi:hypothetical protein